MAGGGALDETKEIITKHLGDEFDYREFLREQRTAPEPKSILASAGMISPLQLQELRETNGGNPWEISLNGVPREKISANVCSKENRQ